MKSLLMLALTAMMAVSLCAADNEPDFPAVGSIYCFEAPPGQNVTGMIGRVLAISKANPSWIQVLPSFAKTSYNKKTEQLIFDEPFATKTGDPFWLNLSLRQSATFMLDFVAPQPTTPAK